jgi:hypothetical protein
MPSTKSQIEELLGDETDNYTVNVALLKGIQNMMHAPPGAKPSPAVLIVVLHPKCLTFDDEIVESVTGRRMPDKTVTIRGRQDAVLEVLKELMNKK